MNDNMTSLAKAMILATVEKIVKLNTKAAKTLRVKSLRDSSVDQDPKDFRKKMLNLCYILYPEIEAVRAFIEKEHPEYTYVIDDVEEYVAQDTISRSEVIVLETKEGAA